MPLFVRTLEDLHDLVGQYEDHLKDESNQVFQQNKLMKWVRVQILRVPDMPCAQAYFGDRECLKPLYLEEYVEDDFDGVHFQDSGPTAVRTTYNNKLPSAGHAKSFRVVDDESGEIIWREQINKEIFRFPDKLIDADYKVTTRQYEDEVTIHTPHAAGSEEAVRLPVEPTGVVNAGGLPALAPTGATLPELVSESEEPQATDASALEPAADSGARRALADELAETESLVTEGNRVDWLGPRADVGDWRGVEANGFTRWQKAANENQVIASLTVWTCVTAAFCSD